MSCLSCKTRSSIERCQTKAIGGLPYCGRHMRCKKIHRWISKNPEIEKKLVHIQSLWRGHHMRTLLHLAGPGVLRRSLCHNDDELVTLEHKTEVHPRDYFAIEEDGKIWWFDQRSMFQWSQKELDIRNPYTRTILTVKDQERLRELLMYRRRHNVPLYHEGQRSAMTLIEKRDNRWLRVAQIIREFAFDIHHEQLISMDYPQLAVFVNTLTEDMRWVLYQPENKHASDRMQRYHYWLKNMRNVMHTYQSETMLSNDVAGIILNILYDTHCVGDFVFHMYSAYHRSNEFMLIV